MPVMFSLKDLIALLDRWDEWTRIKKAADQVPKLESRLAALENKLAGKGGKQCPQCGSLDVKLSFTRLTPKGNQVIETWECPDCQAEFRNIH